MQLLHFKKDIPFMSYGVLTTSISMITFVLAVFFLVYKGLHLGVDFTGGTQVLVRYPSAPVLDDIRRDVDKLNLGEYNLQNYGNSREVMIRLPQQKNESGAHLSERLVNTLLHSSSLKESGQCAPIRQAIAAANAAQNTTESDLQKKKLEQLQNDCFQLSSVDFVGPSVGKELVSDGIKAILVVCAGIILYLAVRFEWRFALAAIIANMHDVVIILGFFAFFQWEFSLPVLAGVLAVLGYSVNESVVVFDRVRENFRKREFKEQGVAQIMDNAITRTMSRTIITHLCTQMMVTTMLFFGGEALHNFALALTIGILFGIYSSVLVACPVAMWLGVSREHFIKPVQEDKAEAQV